mmetsp:Transcript_6819/g.13002  ORF Transcript_6819/g.13002 Transcript_6819/m.13002 type:complete len:206 (-) Transcript_6819:8-625(-)
MPLGMSYGNVVNDDIVWRRFVDKELDFWALDEFRKICGEASSKDKRESSQRSFYQVPKAGERVTILGTKRRTEMNGAVGEVIDPNPDERGRVQVLVFDPVEGTGRKPRMMKVKSSCLLRTASDPSMAATTQKMRDIARTRHFSPVNSERGPSTSGFLPSLALSGSKAIASQRVRTRAQSVTSGQSQSRQPTGNATLGMALPETLR